MIDLGEIGPGDYVPESSPPRRLPRGGPSRLRVLAAVIAVVVCGGVAGTAPSPWLPTIHRVGSLLDDAPITRVVGDVLIDLDFERGLLRAHELDGSGQRWQVAFEPGTWPSVQQAGGLVLVALQWPVRQSEDGFDVWIRVRAAGVRALDLTTGAEVWRSDGFPVTPADGGLVVLQGPGDRIAGVDVASGAELWRRAWHAPIRTAATMGPQADPQDAVTIAAADGTIETVETRTGRVRGTVHVRPGAFEAYTLRDLVGVNYLDANGVVLEFQAYRLGHDRPLWRRVLSPASGGVWPCAETVLCIQTSPDTREAVDPATGRVVSFPPEASGPDGPEAAPWTGGWERIGELAGRALATRRNTGPAPYFTWLGVQTSSGIRALMPIAEGIVFCGVGERWLVCNDERVPRSAYAVRVADLERLIGELG
ncbi:MAG: PQQ-binding-like beta-propeller repeat protein [Hamadaea sp.]|nr:PQQ-binding-like beta-propeller repeat protein [Hamadaea sp.]